MGAPKWPPNPPPALGGPRRGLGPPRSRVAVSCDISREQEPFCRFWRGRGPPRSRVAVSCDISRKGPSCRSLCGWGLPCARAVPAFAGLVWGEEAGPEVVGEGAAAAREDIALAAMHEERFDGIAVVIPHEVQHAVRDE